MRTAFDFQVTTAPSWHRFVLNHRERILRLEHENKKLKEQKEGEQEEQVLHLEFIYQFVL